jgi:hypothetical protein
MRTLFLGLCLTSALAIPSVAQAQSIEFCVKDGLVKPLPKGMTCDGTQITVLPSDGRVQSVRCFNSKRWDTALEVRTINATTITYVCHNAKGVETYHQFTCQKSVNPGVKIYTDGPYFITNERGVLVGAADEVWCEDRPKNN